MTKVYRNKKVFITGHSGFKGAWLTLWLTSLGAEVFGYSLEPESPRCLHNVLELDKCCSNIFADILDGELLSKTMNRFEPDIVFHLAAQPLVRRSYVDPILTYRTNVMGSLNVLEAARQCPSVKAFVNVTTDKCYENKENFQRFREDDPVGGYDMYSSSKACVEVMSASYRRSFLRESFALATARAGNVIGGGDWAEDRLIPDCVRALEAGEKIVIRHPHAIRPWQHVLEPLSGYLILGSKLLEYGSAYAEGFNFGPEENSETTVADVVRHVIGCYGRGDMTLVQSDDVHEAEILLLNTGKAKRRLGWRPILTIAEAVSNTIAWYKAYNDGGEMKQYTLQQIEEFERKCS